LFLLFSQISLHAGISKLVTTNDYDQTNLSLWCILKPAPPPNRWTVGGLNLQDQKWRSNSNYHTAGEANAWVENAGLREGHIRPRQLPRWRHT